VKEYLKMSDVFDGVSASELRNLGVRGHEEAAIYAAHAINSHDELVTQRDGLLYALKQLLCLADSFSVSGVYFNEFAENVAVIDLA
jgi:hypothetical protein